jgi:hypothetical protein
MQQLLNLGLTLWGKMKTEKSKRHRYLHLAHKAVEVEYRHMHQ